jgi:hypothetical protein
MEVPLSMTGSAWGREEQTPGRRRIWVAADATCRRPAAAKRVDVREVMEGIVM